MKKFLHIAFGLLVSASAFAQQPAATNAEPKTPEDRAKFLTEKMAAELQLTDAKKSKCTPSIWELPKKMKAFEQVISQKMKSAVSLNPTKKRASKCSRTFLPQLSLKN